MGMESPTTTQPPRARAGAAWELRRYDLRFVFGEFCVATRHHRALVQTLPFFKLPPQPDPADLPLDRLGRDADAIVFPSHPVDAPPRRMVITRRYLRYAPARFCHHGIDLVGCFADYLQRLSAKSRHEMLRKTRKFNAYASAGVVCAEYRTEREIADFYSQALAVSRRTYQARLLQVGLPESDEFRNELLALASRDSVRGYILFFDHRPIAYAYCRAVQDVLLYETTGYDPEFRKWSPGIVLLHGMLERIFAEQRFRFLDLGSGEAHWKRSHATHGSSGATFFYFPPTTTCIFTVLLHATLTGLSNSIVGLLSVLHLKQSTKKLLRLRFGTRAAGRADE